jgi:hypothetical protein
VLFYAFSWILLYHTHDGVLSRRGVDDVRLSSGLRGVHCVLQVVLAPSRQIPWPFLGENLGSSFVLVHAEARQTCVALEVAAAIWYVHHSELLQATEECLC